MDSEALKKDGRLIPKKRNKGMNPAGVNDRTISPAHVATSYCKQSITFSVASINNIENDRS